LEKRNWKMETRKVRFEIGKVKLEKRLNLKVSASHELKSENQTQKN